MFLKYIYSKNSTLKQLGLLVCCLLVMTVFAFGQSFPAAPKGLVSDFTNTLSTGEVNALEHKLLAFEDSTSTQIAVVLVQSTDGYDVADYAVRLAKEWGIGQKKYNNGIILLAALGDRAVTIQTGYGIEGALPDVIAYRIIEDDIKPAFKRSDYYEGLNAATSSIISFVKGEYKADPSRQKSEESGASGLGSILVVVVVFIVIAIISKGGGGNNRGGKVIDGKGGSDLFWWMLLNGLGRGGFGGGDRNSGGGFGDGGGFGGFGGGDFGGGGASGRW